MAPTFNISLFNTTVMFVFFSILGLSSILGFLYTRRNLTNSKSLLGPLQFLQYYDMLSVVFVYVTAVSLLFVFNIFGLQLLKFNVLVCTFGVYLQPVLFLPLFYMFVFGTNTLLCLGLTQKTSFIGAFINDCITLVSFLLRFLSQYIRIILIILVFILFYEYLNTVSNVLTGFQNNLSNTSVNSVILVLIRVIFELCDCFFILLMQFNTFFIILLWLLSFLFVLKFNNIFEV